MIRAQIDEERSGDLHTPPEKQKFKSFQLKIMRKNFPDKKSKNFYTLNFIKFQQFLVIMSKMSVINWHPFF